MKKNTTPVKSKTSDVLPMPPMNLHDRQINVIRRMQQALEQGRGVRLSPDEIHDFMIGILAGALDSSV